MLAACGRGGDARTPGTEVVHEGPGTTPAPIDGTGTAPSPSDGTAQVRLLGVEQGPFTSTRVKVKAVELRANGQLLDSSGLVDGIDLAVANQAWLLATFKVPSTVDAVALTVVFENAGTFETDRAQGGVDAGCTAIRATLPVNLLALRSHAVIHLDLSRSLVKVSESAAMLVPQFKVDF
jgi:hypothetical protein